MRIGFLLFILGLSVAASAQMYRVGGTSRASFGSQRTDENSAPATRTFSSYGARQQRTQNTNTQPVAQTADTAANQPAQTQEGTSAPTPAAPKEGKALPQKGKNNPKKDSKEGEKKQESDQQQAQAAAMSQVQSLMNSMGLSAPTTGVPQSGQKDEKGGNTSRTASGNAGGRSNRGGSFNRGTADNNTAQTPQGPDMSAIMQAASSGQMPDLSALMGGQTSGKK